MGRVTCAAMLCGMALSPGLWFRPDGSFPRAPLFKALPQSLVAPTEYVLAGLLIAALAWHALAGRPRRCLTAAVILLVLLVVLDQTRLQPWVYQYLLLLVVAALHGGRGRDERTEAQGLAASQLIVAALYFWGGVQKLNYSFLWEVVPQLLAPLRDHRPLAGGQLAALGVGVALCEIFLGVGLLLKRTRRLCVCLALAMHVLVLGLLIWQGRNSVVWAWNAALMALVVILFRRGEASTRRTFADWGAGVGRVSGALALGCAALPLLSFWGWWDMNLSGALYSGNKPVAVVRVDGGVYEKLPPTARRHVFETKSGELMLPVFEWAMADLNVPPYPEPRVFEQVTRELCELAEDRSRVELIMKERPAILDGSYAVSRMSCPKPGE